MQTIGHDPYASSNDPKSEVDAASEEQQQGLLLLARLNSVKNGKKLHTWNAVLVGIMNELLAYQSPSPCILLLQVLMFAGVAADVVSSVISLSSAEIPQCNSRPRTW